MVIEAMMASYFFARSPAIIPSNGVVMIVTFTPIRSASASLMEASNPTIWFCSFAKLKGEY
ncbi:hypothetical protein D9M68_983360 [compost metagenome]